MVAAQRGGAGALVDPRPCAVGSIAETYERYPHIGCVLPAMGYSDEQLLELEQTINATDCDVVVSASSVDLTRLVDSRHPIRHATYELEELGRPTLTEVLAPLVELVELRAGAVRDAISDAVEAEQVGQVADDRVRLARP